MRVHEVSVMRVGRETVACQHIELKQIILQKVDDVFNSSTKLEDPNPTDDKFSSIFDKKLLKFVSGGL